MKGLRYLLSLDLSKLTDIETETTVPPPEEEKDRTSTSTSNSTNNQRQQQPTFSLHSSISSNQLLESVEWLPHVSEMKDTEVNSSHFPVFPLSGPVFPDDQGNKLPLISQFSDVPVAGMEIPLTIFEPRYRQMYQDLLSSGAASTDIDNNNDNDNKSNNNTSRRFIVPFSHPYRAGQFAAFGWIYEIAHVQDVADESNGRFQLVCNHIVTKPVKILEIANPTDYDTKLTYLRARAEIIHNDEDEGIILGEEEEEEEEVTDSTTVRKESYTDLQPLDELLRQLQNRPLSLSSDNNNRQIDNSLIDRLLMALGEGSIWPVAQVWISNLQIEILRLQMKISSRIQLQAVERQRSSNDSRQWQELVTEEMVLLAQEPYKCHLKSMLIEVSTLIPSLLQEGSHRAQCQRMCERIRERLVNETEPS